MLQFSKIFDSCLGKLDFLWYCERHKCDDREQVVSSKAYRDMPDGVRQKVDGEMNTFREQRPETVRSEVGGDGCARDSATV